ncbi:hypothetical protein BDV39DRAFT_172941 [Aspergillus sergii]|uniref:Uncharacterized protein n=1 Tax=Aspergillus sergii TaxID=1034303 RepID=A0A5N6X6V9_9EURO|nr:hypothetical protein BDV39DRAFT_172941 [Aspergillus sergii]
MFGPSLFVVAGALIRLLLMDAFNFFFFSLLSLRSSFGCTKMGIFLVANSRRNSHYSYYLMILLGIWHRY